MQPDHLTRIDGVFEDAGIGYAFTGRTAAWLWGGGRVRGDEIEVLARLLPGDVDELLAAAAANHIGVDAGLAALAAEEGEHLTLFVGGDVFVDVKPVRGASDLAALRTRVEVPRPAGLPGLVQVVAVEECIARLLDDGTEDAVQVARLLAERHRDRLDQDYLGQRCEDLGVLPLLHEVRGEPSSYLSA